MRKTVKFEDVVEYCETNDYVNLHLLKLLFVKKDPHDSCRIIRDQLIRDWWERYHKKEYRKPGLRVAREVYEHMK